MLTNRITEGEKIIF